MAPHAVSDLSGFEHPWVNSAQCKKYESTGIPGSKMNHHKMPVSIHCPTVYLLTSEELNEVERAVVEVESNCS